MSRPSILCFPAHFKVICSAWPVQGVSYRKRRFGAISPVLIDYGKVHPGLFLAFSSPGISPKYSYSFVNTIAPYLSTLP